MKKRTIGYGLLGAGAFGDFCLRSYRHVEGLRPVAVWSRTKEKAVRFAAEHGLRRHESLEAFLSDPEIDLVHVATIPSLHAEHARAALEHGKHVLCEKPLTTDQEQAEHLRSLSERCDRRLGINFMMRYGPLWQPVKTLIEEGLLGAPLRAEVVNCAGDLPLDHWFWDSERSGGIFVEHGVHFFDLIASWFDGEGSVLSAHRSLREGAGVEDQVHCDVRYGKAASAGFYHGFHQSSPLDRQQVRLIFRHGEIVLSGWVAGAMRLHAEITGERRRRLQELFPGARFTFSQTVRDAGYSGESSERDDAVTHVAWDDRGDSQERYAAALRALMVDFLAGIHDPSHVTRVGVDDAVAAVRQALQARRHSLERAG